MTTKDNNVENLINDLTRGPTEKSKNKIKNPIKESRLSKAFFYLAMFCFALSLIFAFIFGATHSNIYAYISSALVVLAPLLVMVHQTLFFGGLVRNFWKKETIFNSLKSSATEANVFAKEINFAYEPETLLAASKLLKYEVTRFRERFSLIFGAVEKLGLIPSIVSLFFMYFTFQKLPEFSNLFDSYNYLILFGYTFFWILFFRFTSHVQAIEKACVFLEIATNMGKK